jgi:hypothetical protein
VKRVRLFISGMAAWSKQARQKFLAAQAERQEAEGEAMEM